MYSRPKGKSPCGKKPRPRIRAMPSFAGSSSSQSPVTHPTIPISGSCPIRMPLRSGSFRCLGPICMCPTTFCCRRIPAYCQRPQHHYASKRTGKQVRSLEPKSKAPTHQGRENLLATREREAGNSAEKICKQPRPQRPWRGTSAMSGLARTNNIGLRDDLAWWL